MKIPNDDTRIPQILILNLGETRKKTQDQVNIYETEKFIAGLTEYL